MAAVVSRVRAWRYFHKTPINRLALDDTAPARSNPRLVLINTTCPVALWCVGSHSGACCGALTPLPPIKSLVLYDATPLYNYLDSGLIH